jgi:lysophospholipase L1-like esterase
VLTTLRLLLLAPLLVGQGLWVRGRTPTLPEAAGARTGTVGAGRTLRLSVVGESTAAGVGAERMSDGLAARLALHLSAEQTVTWTVHARTGATVTDVLAGLVPTEPCDVAVVVLGVNDTLRLRRPALWRAELATLVTRLPAQRVVLCGVPDLGAFTTLPEPLRGVLGRHARALDAGTRAVAAATGATHAPVPAILPGAFAADRFHPSAEAYDAWAADLASRL